MKKIANYSLVALFVSFTMLTSCSGEDAPSSLSPTSVINNVTQGTWRVTYYLDSNLDETNDFSGYNFTFGANNVLSATNGNATVTGSWSVVSDSSSDDDSSSSDLDFNIAFASPANFADLTDDWDIVSYTSTKIELIDVSGGNGGTDYLTFTKN